MIFTSQTVQLMKEISDESGIKATQNNLSDFDIQQAIKNIDDAFKHSTNAYFSLWVISTSTLFASRYRTYAL